MSFFSSPVNDSVQNFLFAKSSSNDPILITVNGIFHINLVGVTFHLMITHLKKKLQI